MYKDLALRLADELRVSIIQIVREEYEMILLEKIFQGPLGKKIVFKGGTALRLAYTSPRFSEDLDFTQIESISFSEFEKWCQKTAGGNSSLELGEVHQKRSTLFALFKIKDQALSVTISIKVEISTRKERLKINKDYVLIDLKSKVTPLTALGQVATIEKVQKEKLGISPLRIRDVFDLWFLGQRLNQPYTMKFSGFKRTEVKAELNRLLDKGTINIIEKWLPRN